MLAGVLLTGLMAKSPVGRRVAGGERVGTPLVDEIPGHVPIRNLGRVRFRHGCHEGSSRVRDRCHVGGRHGAPFRCLEPSVSWCEDGPAT
jgi:hypothetical protein